MAELTEETAQELLRRLGEFADVIPIIEALGEAVVFRKKDADEIYGLNKQTLSKSKTAETFEEVGHRRVFVDLKSIAVYKKRKKK